MADFLAWHLTEKEEKRRGERGKRSERNYFRLWIGFVFFARTKNTSQLSSTTTLHDLCSKLGASAGPKNAFALVSRLSEGEFSVGIDFRPAFCFLQSHGITGRGKQTRKEVSSSE